MTSYITMTSHPLYAYTCLKETCVLLVYKFGKVFLVQHIDLQNFLNAPRRFLQYVIKSCFRKKFQIGLMTLLLNVWICSSF